MTQYLNGGELWEGVITDSEVDVANGVARLDANTEIRDSVIPGLSNKYLIGDDLLHSYDDAIEFHESSGAYIKRKTITINTLNRTPSTIRIKFDLKILPNNTVYGKLYKNGEAVGIERSTGSNTYVTFSEDLSFAEGDTLELWTHVDYNPVVAGYCANFRVYGIFTPLTLKEAIEASDMGETNPFVGTNS